MDLDRVIQYMPPGVREKILSDLIALKIKNKATPKWVATHRNIRGCADVHEELLVTEHFYPDRIDNEPRWMGDDDADLDRAFEESLERGERKPVCGLCHRCLFWGCDC